MLKRATISVSAAASAAAAGRSARPSVRHASSEVPLNRNPMRTYGPGGRSSVRSTVATVFGAYGFSGRYVVSRLSGSGAACVIPFRGSDLEPRHLKVYGDLGRVITAPFSPRDDESVRRAVKHSDVVINMAGKYYETKHFVPWIVNYSFEDVHVTLPRTIARIAKEQGASRFIHVSALGASLDSPSPFLRSKALGELAVKEAFPGATIVRPAPMFGDEDRFLNWFVSIYRQFGKTLLVDGGAAKVQPVFVQDVASAIAAAAADEWTVGKTLELAGPEVLTYKEVAEYMFAVVRERPQIVNLPLSAAKLVGKALNLTPFPVITEDEMIRMSIDTVLDPESKAVKLADFEIVPRTVESAGFNVLYLHRKGGHFIGS